MTIGVLLFETAGERVKGDPGFPGTFQFAVEYGIVKGSYRDLIEGSPEVCERLCRAARMLEQKGVFIIAGDCGLMALYQRELSHAVHIPVVTSSLLLLPLMQSLLSPGCCIGVITGHSALLDKRHFSGAGAERSEHILIQGMEHEPHFKAVVLEGGVMQQCEKMRADVKNAAQKLLARATPRPVAMLLLECSNLSVFRKDLAETLHIPVLDINAAIHLLCGLQL